MLVLYNNFGGGSSSQSIIVIIFVIPIIVVTPGHKELYIWVYEMAFTAAKNVYTMVAFQEAWNICQIFVLSNSNNSTSNTTVINTSTTTSPCGNVGVKTSCITDTAGIFEGNIGLSQQEEISTNVTDDGHINVSIVEFQVMLLYERDVHSFLF